MGVGTKKGTTMKEDGKTILNESGGVALTSLDAVSYTHLRAHETVLDLVCRLLLEKKKYHILNDRLLLYLRKQDTYQIKLQ